MLFSPNRPTFDALVVLQDSRRLMLASAALIQGDLDRALQDGAMPSLTAPWAMGEGHGEGYDGVEACLIRISRGLVASPI